MLINSTILEKGLRANFHQSYGELIQQPHLAAVQELYTLINSNAESESYAWLGDVPIVREWIGEKNIGALKDYGYSIKNKDFYSGFSIDRNELDDEQMPAILPRVRSLSEAVARFPWQLVVNLIINGTSGLAYDGEAFFGTSRGAPNVNTFAGTGTSVAQIRADIANARARMMRFTSDTGRPMGTMMDTIVCPPEIESVVLEAVRGNTVIAVDGTGQSFNPANGWIRNVITFPELTDNNDWYGFATGGSLKPFILQMRKNAEPILDDTQVKRNRKLDYSAEMRGNAGYGFWQMAIKVTNT
jgi:phage major head subunit gpT-like protein